MSLGDKSIPLEDDKRHAIHGVRMEIFVGPLACFLKSLHLLFLFIPILDKCHWDLQKVHKQVSVRWADQVAGLLNLRSALRVDKHNQISLFLQTIVVVLHEIRIAVDSALDN